MSDSEQCLKWPKLDLILILVNFKVQDFTIRTILYNLTLIQILRIHKDP